MIYRKGDLLKQQDIQVIAHQANCFCCMGAGIAAQIAKQFPEAELVDNLTTEGDRSKLGTFSITKETKPFLIANIYSQFYPGGGETRYGKFEEGLQALVKYMKTHNLTTLGLPYKIGCGIAGGDWSIMLQVIEDVQDEHPDINIIIVEFGG